MTSVSRIDRAFKTLPQNVPVFTSIDDEGNGYREVTLNWIGEGAYTNECGDIEIGILEKLGYSEEDIKENPCVVIG